MNVWDVTNLLIILEYCENYSNNRTNKYYKKGNDRSGQDKSINDHNNQHVHNFNNRKKTTIMAKLADTGTPTRMTEANGCKICVLFTMGNTIGSN